jgi:ketosteroid isomerase-like protein
MRTIKCIMLTAASAALLTACGGPAANQPLNSAGNSNANAAKPMAAAPTKETLLAMDKAANEAYTKGDSSYFETNLSDKFVMYTGGQRHTKADAIKMIGTVKCEMKSGPTLDDAEMAMIDADTYVISYRNTSDGTCNDGPGGKSEKVPSPVRGATVWVRNGEKWQAAYHGETKIMEAPAADDKGAAKDTKAAPKADTKSDDARKDAKPAVEDDKMAKSSDDKKIGNNKIAPGKAADDKTAKTDDRSAANSSTASAAKPETDANTDALTKLHNSGWEAWRNKDAAAFDKMLTANASFIGPDGSWHSGKADVIKLWTTMNCTGVTKTSFHDTFASALSPTVEMLTGIGTSDGTCDGHKNGDLYQTAIYVKEGNDWRLAFMFESPKM